MYIYKERVKKTSHKCTRVCVDMYIHACVCLHVRIHMVCFYMMPPYVCVYEYVHMYLDISFDFCCTVPFAGTSRLFARKLDNRHHWNFAALLRMLEHSRCFGTVLASSTKKDDDSSVWRMSGEIIGDGSCIPLQLLRAPFYIVVTHMAGTFVLKKRYQNSSSFQSRGERKELLWLDPKNEEASNNYLVYI